MDRIGVALPIPHPLPVQDYIAAAKRAEAVGYESVWIPEVAGPDATSLAAAIAVETKRVRIGTGIISVFTRHPTLTAITAATLGGLSQGRFVLGLGVSSHTIVQEWQGIPFTRPLARTREYVEIVRQVVAGGKVVCDGKIFHIRNYRAAMVMEQGCIPIYLAALQPPMLRLAGEIADGVILNWVPAERVPDLIREVEVGAKKAGRSLADIDITCLVRVCIAEAEDRVRAWLRRELTGYTIVELYNRYFTAFGFSEEARSVLAAWQQGDRAGATAQVSERMLKALAAFGSAEACRERIAEFHAAGVNGVIAFPFSAEAQPRDSLLHTLTHLLA